MKLFSHVSLKTYRSNQLIPKHANPVFCTTIIVLRDYPNSQRIIHYKHKWTTRTMHISHVIATSKTKHGFDNHKYTCCCMYVRIMMVCMMQSKHLPAAYRLSCGAKSESAASMQCAHNNFGRCSMKADTALKFCVPLLHKNYSMFLGGGRRIDQYI